MPTYCSWINNTCAINSSDPLMGELGKINDEKSLFSGDLIQTFSDNCGRITSELQCTAASVPTFCKVDDTTNKCVAIEDPEEPSNEMPHQVRNNYCQSLKVENCHEANKADSQYFLCNVDEILSENGQCVKRPWADFIDCNQEVAQGACPHGSNPNRSVNVHCPYTCAIDFLLPDRGLIPSPLDLYSNIIEPGDIEMDTGKDNMGYENEKENNSPPVSNKLPPSTVGNGKDNNEEEDNNLPPPGLNSGGEGGKTPAAEADSMGSTALDRGWRCRWERGWRCRWERGWRCRWERGWRCRWERGWRCRWERGWRCRSERAE